MESLIAQYGYLAVVLGTFFEGETVLVLAGFAAHRGYLDLGAVIGCAFAGTLLGDQLYYYIGRRHGARFLQSRPRWQRKVERVKRLLEEHQTKVILSFRFLYGIRTVAPFAIGMAGVSRARYLMLNVLGAALWAVAVGTLGYYFGHALEVVLEDVKRYELAAFALIALLGGGLWAVLWWRQRQRRG